MATVIEEFNKDCKSRNISLINILPNVIFSLISIVIALLIISAFISLFVKEKIKGSFIIKIFLGLTLGIILGLGSYASSYKFAPECTTLYFMGCIILYYMADIKRWVVELKSEFSKTQKSK